MKRYLLTDDYTKKSELWRPRMSGDRKQKFRCKHSTKWMPFCGSWKEVTKYFRRPDSAQKAFWIGKDAFCNLTYKLSTKNYIPTHGHVSASWQSWERVIYCFSAPQRMSLAIFLLASVAPFTCFTLIVPTAVWNWLVPFVLQKSVAADLTSFLSCAPSKCLCFKIFPAYFFSTRDCWLSISSLSSHRNWLLVYQTIPCTYSDQPF